jgi:hypothetical protein
MSFKFLCVAGSSNAVVEQSTHNPYVVGSNLTTTGTNDASTIKLFTAVTAAVMSYARVFATVINIYPSLLLAG